MKYALIILETPDQMARRRSPDAPAYWAAWSAFGAALHQAGIAAGGAGLEQPDTARTVRFTRGKTAPTTTVQDGPYADSKELLGGFFVVDVPDFDTALAWAAKAPLTPGASVEVRPLMRMPG